MKYIINKTKYVVTFFTMLFLFAVSCEDVLDKQPLDKLSKETFWKNETDAELGLMALYNGSRNNPHDLMAYNFYVYSDCATDNGRERNYKAFRSLYDGITNSSDSDVRSFWSYFYMKIARCNNFIENIELVVMDANKIAEMKAEAMFLRAYYYFWMTQLWGSVPLVTNTLTIDEANSVSRETKDNLVKFVLNELTEAEKYLPKTRPNSETGRIVKAAALAIKGRLLMAEKKWTQAAEAYQAIIDMGIYKLQPDYKKLFEDEGENNNETIFALQYLENDYGSELQRNFLPFMVSGWHDACVYNELVESYVCSDGLPIDKSPLYDINNPFKNRDPRLYATCFLPNYTVFKGKLFVSHPDSAKAPDRLPIRTWSGIAIKKFADEGYSGSNIAYGGDFPLIRYSEVLLSYLESKLEAGESISQNLLDNTINKVRQRQSVNLPSVTQTNPELLRPILRRERRSELAFEGLRLFDLLRWRVAHILLGPNARFHGVKITNDPKNYKGSYIINENGYYFYEERNFREDVDYLLPIPLSEIDINPNLIQNPGY